MQHPHQIEYYINKCISAFPHDIEPTLINNLKLALEYKLENKSPDVVRNTYLKDLEIPQIVLFDILANRFPLVLNAHKIVTHAIIKNAQNKKHITLIDLGIGRGLQAKRIIDAFNRETQIESLTVIGIEIMKEALDFTTEILNELKSQLNFTLNFIPIHIDVESLDIEKIKDLSPSNTEAIIINASLTLHHIQTDVLRLELFNKMASLQPSLITLIEPNTNCHTNDFDVRLLNVYEHFTALFLFIDTLELLPEEKKGLKQFFSTELFDAVALPDEHRFERYAPSTDWLQMGVQQGLTPSEISSFSKNIKIENITIENPSTGYTNFKYHHSNILGIIALQR